MAFYAVSHTVFNGSDTFVAVYGNLLAARFVRASQSSTLRHITGLEERLGMTHTGNKL